MNDFSKIRKGTNYSAFSRKNLGQYHLNLITLYLNFQKNRNLI
jgi:hypothetical protein